MATCRWFAPPRWRQCWSGCMPMMRLSLSCLAFAPSFLALTAESSPGGARSEEHTSELQSLMRISYAVFCLKKKKKKKDKYKQQKQLHDKIKRYTHQLK